MVAHTAAAAGSFEIPNDWNRASPPTNTPTSPRNMAFNTKE
jgi:hypothetical protein